MIAVGQKHLPLKRDRSLHRSSTVENASKRDQPDRSKINMQRPGEVKYWSRALKVSKEDIQKAVDKVGNSAATVRKELGLAATSRP